MNSPPILVHAYGIFNPGFLTDLKLAVLNLILKDAGEPKPAC